MTRWIACVVATVTAAVAIGACAVPAPPAAALIDGYAVGPPRSVSGEAFRRLEVTARDAVATAWPGMPLTGIQLVSAGTLADGTVQAGTEGPSTFLVVIDVHRWAATRWSSNATMGPSRNRIPARRPGSESS